VHKSAHADCARKQSIVDDELVVPRPWQGLDQLPGASLIMM
jgi:hypothetical protein